MIEVIQGELGTATQLDRTQIKHDLPEQEATLDVWLLALNVATLWTQFLLSAVHLRDVPGQSDPPVKSHPDQTHEVMFVALHPEYGPYTQKNLMDERPGSKFLIPFNYVGRIRSCSDEEVCQLTPLLVKGVVSGVLPIEPCDYADLEGVWSRVIERTLEHIRHGGHPLLQES